MTRVGMAFAGLVALGIVVVAIVLSQQGEPIDDAAGFAMWPVDTSEEAESECVRAESWRYSPEETAEHFATDVLLVDEPEATVGEQSGDGFAAGQIEGKGVPLYDVVSLREAFGCWYVTLVINREGFPEATVGYSGTGDDRSMFVHLPSQMSAFYGRPVVTVGNGDEFKRFDDLKLIGDGAGTLIEVSAHGDTPGHYFLGFVERGGVVDSPEGERVPPPPEIETMQPAPVGESARVQVQRWVADHDKCRGWAHDVGRKHAVRYDLGGVNWELTHKLPRSFNELPNGDYKARLGNIDLSFDFWEFGKGCTLLGRVTTLNAGAERVRSIRTNYRGFEFEFDWGRATDLTVDFGFGDIGDVVTVGRIDGPIAFPFGDAPIPAEPGYYLVRFFRGDRFLGMEGGSLPEPPVGG